MPDVNCGGLQSNELPPSPFLAGGGSSAAADQDVHAWACDVAQTLGLDAQGVARLRNSAELMAEELARWLNQRRERGKSTKDGM